MELPKVKFEDGGEPPEGTPLSFVFGQDRKSGKERAWDIRIEGRASGTLKEWNVEKGCGWIACPDAPSGKVFFVLRILRGL